MMINKNGHVTTVTFITVVVSLMIAFSGWVFNIMGRMSDLGNRTSRLEGDISWIRERLQDIEKNPQAKALLQTYMRANAAIKNQ